MLNTFKKITPSLWIRGVVTICILIVFTFWYVYATWCLQTHFHMEKDIFTDVAILNYIFHINYLPDMAADEVQHKCGKT